MPKRIYGDILSSIKFIIDNFKGREMGSVIDFVQSSAQNIYLSIGRHRP